MVIHNSVCTLAIHYSSIYDRGQISEPKKILIVKFGVKLESSDNPDPKYSTFSNCKISSTND